MYAISRRDLPIAQQAIQAGHAAIEYAFSFGRPPDHHPSYIHLTISNKDELHELRCSLLSEGMNISEFHEPYQDWGLTAISGIFTDDTRHLLSHLKLWRTA